MGRTLVTITGERRLAVPSSGTVLVVAHGIVARTAAITLARSCAGVTDRIGLIDAKECVVVGGCCYSNYRYPFSPPSRLNLPSIDA